MLLIFNILQTHPAGRRGTPRLYMDCIINPLNPRLKNQLNRKQPKLTQFIDWTCKPAYCLPPTTYRRIPLLRTFTNIFVFTIFYVPLQEIAGIQNIAV